MTDAVEPAEIVVDMELTAEDWQDGFTLLYRRRRRPWRIALLVSIPLIVLLVGWVSGELLVAGIVFAITFLWTIWLLTLGIRFFSGILARRMLSNTPMLREPLSYRFTAEGLTVAVGDQPAGGLPWRLLLGYSRDEKALILYDAPMRIRVFPRRFLSVADLDRIAALAEAGGLRRI